MNVWWCEVERVGGTAVDRAYLCKVETTERTGGRRDHTGQGCGPMRLVPVDALVLVRDADGTWPGPIDDAPPPADIQAATEWLDSHAWPLEIVGRVSLGALYYAAKAFAYIMERAEAAAENPR